MELLAEPSSERQFIMYEALRKGADVEELYRKTYIKPWFIEQMKELVELEEKILKYKGKELPDELLDAGQEGRLRRPLPRPDPGRTRGRDPQAPHRPWAWSRAGTPCRSAASRTPPTTTPPTTPPTRSRRREPQEGHGPRRRPEPHRPGDRVRLLLRPCRLRPARRGLRVDHGQLQPRDGLHRLRHLRQALLRAADRRGCARASTKRKSPKGSSSSSAARRR